MLSNNQLLFCNEYVKNGSNGTKAYLKAYKCKSEEVAMASSSRLLRNVKVKEYIIELQEELKEKSLFKAEDVINELAKIGFFNVKNLYREDGTLKEISEIEDNHAAAISSIKVQQRAGAMKIALNATDEAPIEHLDEWVKEIKAADKIKALELMGKYLGIFSDKVELTDNTERASKIDSLIDSINKKKEQKTKSNADK